MFTTAVLLHLPQATLRPERGEEDNNFPMFSAKLMLEPLTRELAKELGVDIHDHCFTRSGALRKEISRLQLRSKLPLHTLTIRMAHDVAPSAVLKGVQLTGITIATRGQETDQPTPGSKKQKKVGPPKTVLRLTVNALIDPAEREHRDFLCGRVGSSMFYTFTSETPGLPLDGGADRAPDPDDDAGDVLDEQRDLALKDQKKPRLKKGGGK